MHSHIYGNSIHLIILIIITYLVKPETHLVGPESVQILLLPQLQRCRVISDLLLSQGQSKNIHNRNSLLHMCLTNAYKKRQTIY